MAKSRKFFKLVFYCNVFIWLSCNNTKEEEKYDTDGQLEYLLHSKNKDTLKYFQRFDNGTFVYKLHSSVSVSDTLKEYYPNGNLMLQAIPSENSLNHIKIYEPNGMIKCNGYLFNEKNIGWWNYYKQGKLSERVYFVQHDNELLLQQFQFFDKNGTLDTNKSDFIDILIPDTLYQGRSTGTIAYKRRNDYNEESVLIGYNLKPDYSNINEVRIDTFYNPKRDGFFGVEFDKLGRNKIRGVIETRKTGNIERRDSLFSMRISITNRYFEKEFYVIPRPDSIPKNKVMRYDNLLDG